MSTSPISKMNDDCLLWVFDSITSDMPDLLRYEDRPLKTIRAASQSCRRWRQVLLSSPFIWARLVDLDQEDETSGPKSTEWMEEIVRRAGSSPLWVYGWVAKPGVNIKFDSWSFFIDVLQSWEQIEKLCISMQGNTIPDAIQRHFLLPAPMLKTFLVDFCDLPDLLFLDTLQRDSSQQLFGDYAPCLTVIRSDQVAFKPNAPWLSGIREMDPVPPIFTLNPQDFFVLLQHTPLLESVLVLPLESSWAGILPPSTKPQLHNLSSIVLRTNMGVMARIIDYISPRNLSRLELIIFDFGAFLNDDYVIPSLRKNIPVYIASYLLSHPQPVPVEFTLTFGVDSVEFGDVIREYRGATPRSFRICLVFDLDDIDRTSLITCMCSSILRATTLGGANYLFETIIGFTICIAVPELSQNLSNLHSMFAAFRDIEYIRIDDNSASQLWSVSSFYPPNCVLFPKLHTVFLVEPRHPVYPPKLSFDGLAQFLKYRKEIGFPVQKLDLTTYTPSESPKDISEVEDIEGLEVVWKTSGDTIARGSGDKSEVCSYICGSGDRQKLVGII